MMRDVSFHTAGAHLNELQVYAAFHHYKTQADFSAFKAAMVTAERFFPLMNETGIRIENGRPVQFWTLGDYTLIRNTPVKLSRMQRYALALAFWRK